MSREIQNRIDYTVMCVSEFALRYALHPKQSYIYLKNHGGIAFLKDCYDAEHLLSIDDAIDDLTLICKRNGGKIA
ncbi:MAG: DUF3791 domain-containing protein [Firmicutes bacterium]|nr:DUF3791 domain-containing protein [Bacillota bacterium]MCM1393907.1 DUF3791 domain-containing protein [[Eubacterium] siraeum]